MTAPVWREFRTLAPELFRCDLCGAPAETIHLVPSCGIDCERALFACPIHDPGGYWFPVAEWIDERDRWLRHLDEKVDHRAVTADRPGGLALLIAREQR